MTPADVRLTAQLVAAGRVHSVSDEAVMAMARRVLELEDDLANTFEALQLCRETAAHWEGVSAASARRALVTEVAAEREACERVALRYVDEFGSHAGYIAAAIRARGAQGATIAGVSEGNDG